MTRHVLVTILGKARQPSSGGYESVRYRFADGVERRTPFFGLALAEHLQPDRLLVLGTSASMWDFLVEHVAVGGSDEDLRLRLMDACTTSTVDQPLLDAANGLLARALGRPVDARLIGAARDASEQANILQAIADAVGDDDVSIDVTHGFRHLGMLGLESAHLIGMARARAHGGSGVRGVWYGALDMRNGDAVPVLRLDAMLGLHAWIAALARFDESGNYAVFASLLEQDGVARDIASGLRDAWFLESNLNLADARRHLQRVDEALRSPLSGVSELFRERLRQRLAWIKRDNIQEQQHQLALKALERRDYLRAAIFGTEAVISHACVQRGRDPRRPDDRNAVRDELKGEQQHREHPEWWRQAFQTLNGVRNSMAHAMPAMHPSVNELLRNEQRLGDELARCLQRLAPQ